MSKIWKFTVSFTDDFDQPNSTEAYTMKELQEKCVEAIEQLDCTVQSSIIEIDSKPHVHDSAKPQTNDKPNAESELLNKEALEHQDD